METCTWGGGGGGTWRNAWGTQLEEATEALYLVSTLPQHPQKSKHIRMNITISENIYNENSMT